MTSRLLGRRATALLLVVALGGCAPRATLAPSAFSLRPRQQQAADDPAVIRRFVEQLRVGSTIKMVEKSGAKSTVLLMSVDSQGIVVKPKTRIPEPARTVPFDRLAHVELPGSHSFAKGFWIGTAVGAGSVFLWLFYLIATGD